MLPERLTTVTSFGSLELASEDLRKLQEAGLNPYLGGEFHRHHGPVEIRVPESELEKALAILELDPIESMENFQAQTVTAGHACPRCRTADSYRLPPYALYVLVVSVAVLVVALILGQGGFGLAGVMIAWFVAIWLSRYSGKYRCRNCKHEWKPQ